MERKASNRTSGEKRGAGTKRVIAIGKRVDGRWQVRTSLWRYLASTALSNQ